LSEQFLWYATAVLRSLVLRANALSHHNFTFVVLCNVITLLLNVNA
jgi:hypothetical protein